MRRLAATPGKPQGFTLLELVVVIAIIGILAAVFIDRVKDYQERAEKAAMEQVVAALRTALHFQMARLIIDQKLAELEKLALDNPMNWLAEKPGNYRGECFNPKSEEMLPGSWCFDLYDRSLVYALNQSEHFTPENSRVNLIRFRLKILYEAETVQGSSESADKKNIGGIVLQPVRPYHWF